METIKCKKCGRDLPHDKFKLTRWGDYSTVCNECVTTARLAAVKANKEKKESEKREIRLSEFTPRELMQELARRGYEGKLTFTKIETIDITNF